MNRAELIKLLQESEDQTEPVFIDIDGLRLEKITGVDEGQHCTIIYVGRELDD